MKATLVAEQGTADHVGLGLSGLRLASQLSQVGATAQWTAPLSSDCGENCALARVRRRLTEVSMGASDGWSGASSSLCVSPTSMAVR